MEWGGLGFNFSWASNFKLRASNFNLKAYFDMDGFSQRFQELSG
jgi:hypothetical protein